MERYVDGSVEAFDELYRRVSPKLFGYLLKLTRDVTLAEDILQSTFAKVHGARRAYLRGAPVVPWILVIARRTFLDERRAAPRRWETLSDDGSLPELGVDEPGEELEALQLLQRAMAALPPHYRDAIELTKLGGLSGVEAARQLATTHSAVKLRVHRGYQMLRQILAPEAAPRRRAAMPPAELSVRAAA